MAVDRNELLAAARAAATQAHWPEALQSCDALLAEDKTHPVALRLRARALGALERWDEAHATWEVVARVSPDLIEAPLNIARIEKRRGDWPGVLVACDRTLKLQPAHPEAMKLAATAIERDLKSTPSALVWRSLAQADISGFFGIVLELDSQGRLIEASKAIAAGCEVRPDDNGLKQERTRLAQDLAEKASALENSGDYINAAEHLRSAAHLDTANADSYRTKLARLVKPLVVAGREQMQAKNIDAAMSAFTETLAYDHDNHGALIGLARVHEQRDEWPKAVELWARVIALDPSNQLAWLRFGIGSDRIGDPARAKEAYARITDPQYAEQAARGRERLANSAYKAARAHYVAGDFEKAAEALEVAAETLGDGEAIASLKSRVARALARSQRTAFGERDYAAVVRLGERLLPTTPESPEPWILQARALLALKRSAESLAAWSEADKRAPNRSDILLGTARAALDLGALVESRAAIERALQVSPGDQKCLELLAKLDRTK
jgi:tetratricopeptide (TPR) repeat protein